MNYTQQALLESRAEVLFNNDKTIINNSAKVERKFSKCPPFLKRLDVARNFMKLFLIAIFVGSFLFSCDDQKSTDKEIESFVDTVGTSKKVHQTDSLDLDTSSFITSNYPDTVRKVLYKSIDTLWHYVDSSLNQADSNQKEFSRNKLRQLLANSGFTFDGSANQQFSTKRDFNRRYAVDWLTSEPDTITTQVRYWFKGKKYILINQRWNLQN